MWTDLPRSYRVKSIRLDREMKMTKINRREFTYKFENQIV